MFKVEPDTVYSVNMNATVYFFDANELLIESFDAVIKKYKSNAEFRTPINCDRMKISALRDRRKRNG